MLDPFALKSIQQRLYDLWRQYPSAIEELSSLVILACEANRTKSYLACCPKGSEKTLEEHRGEISAHNALKTLLEKAAQEADADKRLANKLNEIRRALMTEES